MSWRIGSARLGAVAWIAWASVGPRRIAAGAAAAAAGEVGEVDDRGDGGGVPSVVVTAAPGRRDDEQVTRPDLTVP